MDDMESAKQNDRLDRTIRQGHDTEDLAIATRNDLQSQTETSRRVDDNLLEMRRLEIRNANKVLTEIEENNRRNTLVLYCIFSMLCLAFTYIVISNFNKQFG